MERAGGLRQRKRGETEASSWNKGSKVVIREREKGLGAGEGRLRLGEGVRD